MNDEAVRRRSALALPAPDWLEFFLKPAGAAQSMIQRASRKNFETSLDSGLRTNSWPCFGNEWEVSIRLIVLTDSG